MAQPVPLDDLPDELRPQPAAGRGAPVPAGDMPTGAGPGTAFALGLATNVPGLQTLSAHAATAARNPAALAQFMKGQTGREQPLGPVASPRGAFGAMQDEPPGVTEDRARSPADPTLTGPYQQALDQRLAQTEGFVRGAEQAHPTAFAAGEWGPLVEAAAPTAGRYLASKLAPKLASAAEKNAIRAMGAPAAVGRLVEREGEQRVPQVARAMLDEGVPLVSPGEAKAGILGVMNDKYGPAISKLTKEASARGGVFDMRAVLNDFNQRAAQMVKDPQQRPIVDAVKEYLSQVAQARGNWQGAGGQRQLFNLSPEEAHQFRQNLDTFLYGVKKNLDPTGTLSKATFNGVRHAVDDELGRVMNEVGLGAQWAPANAGYRNMAAGLKLAKAGVKAEAVREAGVEHSSKWSPIQSGHHGISIGMPPALQPSPAHKAKVQNTLYRLMRPAPPPPELGFRPFRPVSGGAGEPPFTPEEGFTLWKPHEQEPPIPLDPEAFTPAPKPVPQPYAGPTPEELARARSEVLANKKATYQWLQKFRKPQE